VVVWGVEFAREHGSPWTMRCCTGDVWLGGGGEDDERCLTHTSVVVFCWCWGWKPGSGGYSLGGREGLGRCGGSGGGGR
jgi:hypothetical protein